jgi:hypothetical protein
MRAVYYTSLKSYETPVHHERIASLDDQDKSFNMIRFPDIDKTPLPLNDEHAPKNKSSS